MIRSMTAFSRSTLTVESGLLTLEVQSLNRKHLEVHTLLPREFIEFDTLVKKQVQKRLSRGKIQVYLSFTPNERGLGIEQVPNLPLAGELKRGWDQIASHLDIEAKEQGLIQLLIRENNLFNPKLPEKFSQSMKEALLELLEKGLDELCLMREKEGTHLRTELLKHLKRIQTHTKQVESLESSAKEEQHQKLKDRLEKLLSQKMQEDERFLKEVAILVDRSDITEELARLNSHFIQFEEALSTKKDGHGKMLDFITQEMTREWNTIGAKCSDHEIAKVALHSKAECEKIREQVHNIE